MKKQIFLSYGRKDASPVADEVAAFLERHFRVWRDRPVIKPGVPFLEKIEEGIRNSHAVVALLSPHSVRRVGEVDHVDSVCLDELSFARFSRPPRSIVPAMAVSCEPPMVIFRQHYVDLTSKQDRAQGLDDLLEGIHGALQGETRYRSWVDSLRPWDFEPFLREKRRSFVGRDWLHQKVERWLQTQGHEPALLIKGDPGSGKSALVASIVEQSDGRLVGYHCCQANTPETLNPARFVQSIAAMIASRLPAYEARLTNLLEGVLAEKACQADPFSAFEQGVLAPLAALETPPARDSFILIDALDEALALRDGARGATIVDLLADRLARFPPWLRIIATRKEDAVTRRLRGIRHEEIDVHSDQNRDDVETYVRARSARPELAALLEGGGGQVEDLVAAMRAAGNFLFVTEMLEALARGRATLDDLERLPPGLYGLYETFFTRTFPESEAAALATALDLLSVVLAAQQPLSEQQLARATGLDPDQELARTLKRIAPYLPPSEGDEGVRYAVYHKSFADWLQDPDLRGTRFYIATRAGHARLAKTFATEYELGVAGLSRYGLAYGPFHLARAGDNRLLHLVLTDVDYIRAVHSVLGPAKLLGCYVEAAAQLRPCPELDAIAAIGGALRLSLPSVAQDSTELEVQLEARLRHVHALLPFRDRLRAHFAPDVLVPETMPLSPAGSPLLLSLKVGFAVSAVCVHEPAGLIVTGAEDNWLRVWRLADGVPTTSAHVEPRSISCGTAHAVRLEAVFGTGDGALLCLELETGAVRECSAAQPEAVSDLIFNAGGTTLLVARQSTLTCLTWPAGELSWQRTFAEGEVEAVRWTRDGSAIYLLTRDRLLQLSPTGEKLQTLREAPPLAEIDPFGERTTETYTALAVRDDGAIALGLGCGAIEVIVPGKPARTLPGHPVHWYSTSVSGLEFVGPDELVSTGWDDAIRVWSVRTGAELRSLRGTSKVFALAVFAQGRRAATGHKMLATNVWNLQAPGHAPGDGSRTTSLCVSESLELAAACVGRRQVAIWNLATGSRREIELDESVRAVGLDASRSELLVLSGNEILASGTNEQDKRRRIGSIDGDVEVYQGAQWSPNGQVLVVEREGHVMVWRREEGIQRIALPKDEHTIYAITLSDTCLVLGTRREVRLFDLTRKRSRPRIIEIDESPHVSALSPDGKRLALGDEEGKVTGYDTKSAEPLWTVHTKNAWLSHVYRTNHGVLCVAGDDELSVYDGPNQTRLAHLRSENRWGECTLSDDGRTVWASGNEGSLQVLRHTAR